MPMVDMPMEKLLKYKGQSPRPSDFDKYWFILISDMKTSTAGVMRYITSWVKIF